MECIAVRHEREKHHVTSLALKRAPISHSKEWVIQLSRGQSFTLWADLYAADLISSPQSPLVQKHTTDPQ